MCEIYAQNICAKYMRKIYVQNICAKYMRKIYARNMCKIYTYHNDSQKRNTNDTFFIVVVHKGLVFCDDMKQLTWSCL